MHEDMLNFNSVELFLLKRFGITRDPYIMEFREAKKESVEPLNE
jgi:hypothetical protein